MNIRIKIQLLTKEYTQTTVQTGSPTLFFFYFWLTKIFSFLQQHSKFLNKCIHRIVRFLPHPEFVIRNKTGVFVVQPFDDSTTICSDYFEAHLRPWLESAVSHDVLLDIGANRGLYTILALTQYGFQEVHAFEPNPTVCSILEKNIVLNTIMDHTTVHRIGLGKEDAAVGFSVDEMHLGGGRIVNHDATALTVSIKPLDAVIDTATAQRTTFIKIDTEGYENAVLEGATHTLTHMPRESCIMIESTEPDVIATILTPYGFSKHASVAHDHLFIKYAHTSDT